MHAKKIIKNNKKKKKIAFITGVTGQDGSYLAEFLLDKGYEVHGLTRRVAFENQKQRFSRINHILDKLHIHYGDIRDKSTIWRLIAKIMPDEVYHLAAQSQVAVSFEDDFGTFQTNTVSTHYLLSSIKELKPSCKFYFAATSEMFGQTKEVPQNENTRFNPVSPYGISKVAAFHLVKLYRNAYGIFACSGILFNHESPRRGFEFVTRKITSTAVRIKFGLEKKLKLGNLNAVRDWGYAGDYIYGMWKMLQHKKPDDYVLATNESHTVRDFAKLAFAQLGLDYRKYVKVDKNLRRPLDVNILRGDYSKAKRVLRWKPRIKFKDLVRLMVESDLEELKKNQMRKIKKIS